MFLGKGGRKIQFNEHNNLFVDLEALQRYAIHFFDINQEECGGVLKFVLKLNECEVLKNKKLERVTITLMNRALDPSITKEDPRYFSVQSKNNILILGSFQVDKENFEILDWVFSQTQIPSIISEQRNGVVLLVEGFGDYTVECHMAGFIYPVKDSEWVSPVVVTPKKNGKWRVCVDYKPLNAATKRDHFPLPFQDEILNEVAGYERYTVCDGYSGYFQIRIAEEDQKKTTFVTPWGCFAYRVMPFGLTNATATFQRFVTHVFQPFFGKSIRVFIDDFCIYSSRVLHLEKVNEGLARLQSLGGQLNVDKCHIVESQVTLLGHVVSSRGTEADPGKVQALVILPSQKSARELVSFIQKVSAVEDTFPLVLQHMDVSARISKWKVKVKAPGPEPVEVQAKLSGAHSLYFDGAYKRKVDKASVGISIQDENGQKVFGKGLLVENTHSNNEAEYAALALGLEWCVSMGIKRLNVFGDALLLIKQVHGTWACRNQSLVPRLRRVKELMKRFEAIQLYHVPRKGNQEADALANEQLQEVIVGAIKLQNPLFQGSDCMHDIVNFLETGECPQDMSKGQRQWLVPSKILEKQIDNLASNEDTYNREIGEILFEARVKANQPEPEGWLATASHCHKLARARVTKGKKTFYYPQTKKWLPMTPYEQQVLVEEPEVLEQTPVYRIIKKQMATQAMEAGTNPQQPLQPRERKPPDKDKDKKKK
ncbi:hypothetical protein L7F22_006027 [Adiantum nelumboides]|nr:hypothetical protein [Adiantum nelumboides]